MKNKQLKKNLFSVKEKAIAIIGATGMLGTEYAKYLSSMDAKVIIGDLDLYRCEELSEKLLNDINLTKGDKVSILINSLGATPHEELFIVANKFNNILNDNGIINSKSYVGRYATSMEMAGMSITILKLNDELGKHLFYSSSCPFWSN